MKNLLKIVLGILLTFGFLQAELLEQKGQKDGFDIKLSSPKALIVGKNDFVIELSKDSKVVDNAKVKIKFFNGSEIKGLELMQKPGDKEFDKLGSTEYTGGWIEEAAGVGVRAYEVLRSRIGRQYNDKYGIKAKLLLTCNPARNWLYSTFYLPWKNDQLPEYRQFIQAFVTDNTKREPGYIEQLQSLSGEIRARLLLGDWAYEDDPLALVEYDAIVDLFTNDYLSPDNSRRRIVCDVALHGSDLFRIGVFYGDVLVEHSCYPKTGGRQIVTAIKAVQARHSIRGFHIVYDADGVGGFIGQEGGFIPGAIAFHGNAAPLKKKIRERKTKKEEVSEYANLKAQCGFLLAEKINEGKMYAAAVTDEHVSRSGRFRKSKNFVKAQYKIRSESKILESRFM